MTLSMYQASVPVFLRGLEALSVLLAKGAAHAAETGTDPAELLAARLAPDMLPLSAQVQRASDTSKASAERLCGVAAPRMPDVETTFPQLQDRIAATTAYLRGLDAAAFEGSDAREITLKFGKLQASFTGAAYITEFAIPNFFFHVAIAHGILRHKGVPVGKRDFLGPIGA